MPAPTLKVSLVEPVIFLRGARERFGISRSSGSSGSSADWQEGGGVDELNQLRGLVHVNFGDVDSAAGIDVEVTFHGSSVWIDWQNGKGKNREREIVSKSVRIPAVLDESSSSSRTTTTIPFSMPISDDLPPSADADFGSNTYCITASIELGGRTYRSDAALRIEPYFDTEAPTLNVAGSCYSDRINYNWRTEGEACIGAEMPVDLSLMSAGEEEVSVTSLQLSLEESTTYGTESRESTGKPIVRRWPLLKLRPSPPKEELLPWSAWGTECVLNGKLDAEMVSAAQLFSSKQQQHSLQADVKSSVTSQTKSECDLREDLLMKTGPWSLAWRVRIPSCIHTAINNTILHDKSAVAVTHRLVLQMSFKSCSSPSDTVMIKRPIRVLSSHLAGPGNALPCYWCDTLQDHPYSQEETWRKLEQGQCDSANNTTTSALPNWLRRLLKKPIVQPDDKTAQTDDYAKNGMQWLQLTSQAPPYVE